MLKMRRRQELLKALGFMDGDPSSRKTRTYTDAVLKLQRKYFRRKGDIDGIYGKNTDILLRHVYRCHKSKYFAPEEFRCNCGHCTGYPAAINKQLLSNLKALRNEYGTITITSGLRCKWKNARLSGSSPTSRHMTGKAADIYNPALTGSVKLRNRTISLWYKMPKAHYSYGNTPGMGNAVHVDVK